ncbi:hypothetical protein QYE76_051716 [Lolium multiflorum]|uniref:Reverse transcriptase domain-containing protein n=1 Tax=Lolium multiflorum TaxID=4521 RepID=A0AAD8STW5_LOLMU|nr:hypothetical protein QYE76_051716 [Lolium multiflorum]
MEPLFSPPMSSPPLRPVARRKTLAGHCIIRSAAFSLRRASNRLRAKRRVVPVACQAETFVSRGLGIIKDGEVVTKATLQEFARRFEGQVSADVLLAMRALFRLGVPEDEGDDEAILSLGGAAALTWIESLKMLLVLMPDSQALVLGCTLVSMLHHNNGWFTEHEAKGQIIHNHFLYTMGPVQPRSLDFNWEGLHFTTPYLDCLGDPFTEEEVKEAINQMPSDKAPGPDGFTGAFFKICWDTIKVDVMNVIQLFGSLHSEIFHWLNSANIALLPKKDGAEAISDFRPISLIHAIAKIIAKMLALRLGPLMDDLVCNAQSAFIKRRSIHDNFLYVKNLATRLHKNKTAALLFKLDIRWDYIIDLLQRRGFPHRFCEWVLALFITSTSWVLLNGVAGPPIHHGRGLRQGDPLSPLLFADDAAVFIAPFKEDIKNFADILRHFGLVTGLHTNFEKSSVVPIRCGGIDLDVILEGVPAARTSLPMRGLGLPLSIRSLRRIDFQFLEDKCAG